MKRQTEIVTFGCRLNAYESEVMRGHAEKAGLDNAIVFNTCAVTAEAERQARQAIRKARRENPQARIIVTGCAAQVNPDAFAEMSEVDLVIGNDEKMKAQSWEPALALHANEKVRVNDIMSVTETAGHLVQGLEGRARAFVQVQNGCDHRCTFCIIPYGRGNSRSVPAGEVVSEVRNLVENGYRVLFTRTTDLVQKLQQARRDLSLESAIAKLDKFHLLILDDLSYVTKDQAETSVLFELIATRYEQRSMLITANQPFGEWGKIFPDPAMTLAAVDRLVHHATIFELNVDSYRRRTAMEKQRGPGRPASRATIKTTKDVSLSDN